MLDVGGYSKEGPKKYQSVGQAIYDGVYHSEKDNSSKNKDNEKSNDEDDNSENNKFNLDQNSEQFFNFIENKYTAEFILDELWHFINRKKEKLWCIKAYDNKMKKIAAYILGNRDESTTLELYEKLKIIVDHFTKLMNGLHLKKYLKIKTKNLLLERNIHIL